MCPFLYNGTVLAQDLVGINNVDSLWATTKLVCPLAASRRAANIARSDEPSNELVASSKI